MIRIQRLQRVESFPSILVTILIRAKQGKRNATGNQRILTISVNGTDRDLLMEYHSVTDVVIEAARLNQKNARVIQNNKAMYS